MARRPGGVSGWARAGMILALAAAALLSGARACAQAPGSARISLTIGFSSRVMGRSNRTDLTAAMKAWLLTVAKDRKINVDPHVEIFDSLEEVTQALRQRKVDVISIGMDDFVALEKLFPLAGVFANRVRNKVTDQYVLLVRRDQGLKELADLRGQSIIVLDHYHALLAPLWLDTELLRRRLPVSARFFGKVTYVAKPSLAILPLFFKQAGAVLMNQNAFETAGELNPQIAKDIAVLKASPELVSSVGAYRADATSESATFYQREALKLGETAGGRLILNLFQTDSIVEFKESDLRETRALLAEHARLLAAAPRKEVKP